MSPDKILDQAIQTKQDMDDLTLLGDKLYYCMECGKVTDYWKPGQVCEGCEAEGERQQEMQHESI